MPSPTPRGCSQPQKGLDKDSSAAAKDLVSPRTLTGKMGTRLKMTIAAAATMVAMCTAAVGGAAGAQGSERYKGLRVSEVLRRLQDKGVRIIFSSDLVGPDLRVKREPRTGSGLRDVAEQVLEPHGLTLAAGPRNTWIVVRKQDVERREPTQGRPAPAVPAPQAQPPPPSPPPIRIEERVQVDERAGDVGRVPNVYRIDTERAVDTAGSLENVFQSLAWIPGVAATNDHDNKLAVRGAGPEHNMVVFDGVQIYSHQRQAGDFAGQQSFVNPATVASLALDASGLEARYGGRLSSATLFETRDGPTTRRLGVSGSVGLTSGDVLAEGRLPGTSGGSWWATMRGTYYKLVADRFQDGDIPGFLDAQFKVTLKPSSRTRLSVLGLAGTEGMVKPIGFPPEQLLGLAGENYREFHARNRLAIVNLHWTPSSRLSATTTFDTYSNTSRDQDAIIDWQTGQPFDRRVRIVDTAVRERMSIAWSPRHVLDLGGDVHGLRGSWTMYGSKLLTTRPPGPDVDGQFMKYDGPVDARLDKTQVGAWVQERVPLGRGFGIDPGLRVDWNSFTGETAVQPRFRITKSIRDGGIVWAGLAWQAQTPGFETMQQGVAYYDLAGPSGSDLRNERSRQIVGGVEQRLEAGMTLRIEAYHREFDRLTTQRLETDVERRTRLSRYLIPDDMPPDSAILEHRPTADPESTGTGRATGVEFLLDRARGRVSGWVSYALSKSVRNWYGRTVPFDFDRRHAVGAAVNVALTSKVRMSARSQYGTGFPVTPVQAEVDFTDHRNTFPGPPPGSTLRPARGRNGQLFFFPDVYGPTRVSLLNSTRQSAYARTDLRWTFVFWRDWEAYGEIINLLGHENFRNELTLPGAGPVDYRVAPAFPRMLTYGVRFRF